jgi:phosphomannomutase/phosphoglucomutase
MPCPDDKKFQVIENVKNELLKHYTGFTEDGIRANMPGGWALVRASNTGAKISMRFEADTPQRLDAIEKEVRQIIATYMP